MLKQGSLRMNRIPPSPTLYHLFLALSPVPSPSRPWGILHEGQHTQAGVGSPLRAYGPVLYLACSIIATSFLILASTLKRKELV